MCPIEEPEGREKLEVSDIPALRCNDHCHRRMGTENTGMSALGDLCKGTQRCFS